MTNHNRITFKNAYTLLRKKWNNGEPTYSKCFSSLFEFLVIHNQSFMKCIFIVNDFATARSQKAHTENKNTLPQSFELDFNYKMGMAYTACYIRTSIKLVMNVTENCNDLILLMWKTMHIENPYPIRNSTKLQPTLALLGPSSQFLWRWKTFHYLFTSYAFEQNNVKDKRKWATFHYNRLVGFRLLQTASLSMLTDRLLPKIQVLSLL